MSNKSKWQIQPHETYNTLTQYMKEEENDSAKYRKLANQFPPGRYRNELNSIADQENQHYKILQGIRERPEFSRQGVMTIRGWGTRVVGGIEIPWYWG